MIGYICNVVVYNGMIDVGVVFLFKFYGMGDFVWKICDVFDGGGVNWIV